MAAEAKPLTAEREAEIRRWARESRIAYPVDDLLAEIGRLCSELASAREAALREARHKVRSYAHHALWGDLLDYQWDERTETFARQLVARIDATLGKLLNTPAAGAEGGRDGG